MPETKHDRRTQRTRQLLLNAFTTLLQEQRYDEITVQDIVDRANVGRSTFYAHFMDKDDLLVQAFARVLDMLLLEPEGEAQAGLLISSSALFEHIQGHQRLYQALVRGRGMDILVQNGQAHVSRIVAEGLRARYTASHEPRVPLPVLAQMIAGTLFVLIKWWIENQILYTPQQMDAMFRQFVGAGIQASLERQVQQPQVDLML